MTLWADDDPYLFEGTSDVVTVPSGHTTAYSRLTAPFDGVLTASLNLDDVTYEVYDADGDMIQDDTDGSLGLVLRTGDVVDIHILSEALDGSSGTLTWTYAARASSVLQVVLSNVEVAITPGAMSVDMSNGVPNDVVTLSLIGPTTELDFTTVGLDEDGFHSQLAIPLPALQAGDYVLRAETVHSGSTDSDFTVLEDPLSASTHETVDPTPPNLSVTRWTFYDVRDPSDTWTLQRNPKSWSTMLPPNTFTEQPTVAPDGQTLTYEAGSRPWRMEFAGWIDDEDEYGRFVFWSQKRRRLWLIDHRGRSWLLTIEDFDAEAQIKPNLPWAHDYTVKTVIFKQGTD